MNLPGIAEGCCEKLTKLFKSIEESQQMGTLKLAAPDGEHVVYIYFNQGVIEYAKTAGSTNLLGRALIKRRKITEEQMLAAYHRQQEAPRPMSLGQILIEGGLVTYDDIQRALAYQMAEEVFTCFVWDDFDDVFYRGEPPLDIFGEEDREFRVALKPSQLCLEAMRRDQELSSVRQYIPSMHDVCVLTTDSNLLAEGPDRELIALLDGRRDIEDFLDDLPASDFTGLRLLAQLFKNGHAARLDGDQLITLGEQLEEGQDYRRSRKRYLRASEIGHNDFELARRIGQIEEVLGNIEEAVRRYTEYANQCEQADFYDVAIETLRHCLRLEPGSLEARATLASLLERSEQIEEALSLYRESLAFVDDDPQESLNIWLRIVAQMPEDIEARRNLADLYLATENRTQAFVELQELASLYLVNEQLEAAVPVLRKAHELDRDEIMVHESLATTLAKLDRVEDAVGEFLNLARNLQRSESAGIFRPHLTTIYQKILNLDPENGEALSWLAQAYENKKESDKAAQNYKGMLPGLRSEENQEELLKVLEKIYTFTPHDEDIAREYADRLVAAGREDEAVRILTNLAEQAAAEGDLEKESEIYETLLWIEPGHFEAHRTLIRSELNEGDPESAARRYHGMSLLFLASGHLADAEDALRKAVEHQPDDCAARTELAELLLINDKAEQAVKELLVVAKRQRSDDNRGLARRACRRALEIDKDCAEAGQIIKKLEYKKAVPKKKSEVTPVAPSRKEARAMPTITGGGPAQVQVLGVPKNSLESVKKLKNVLNRSVLSARSSDKPENVISEATSRKAASGISRLKALRGGGPKKEQPESIRPGPEAPGETISEDLSKKASSGINKLKALRGGGPKSEPPVSPGPEAPGEALPEGLAKKAASGINKLKALKKGEAPSKGPAGGPVSPGPEAPGEALPDGLAKKAASGINKLKALKQGKPGPKPGGPVSAGPEAPGEALSEGLAKKAASGINKLKALKQGKAGDPGPGASVSAGPEAPGEALPEGLAKKAASGINKLKALKKGGIGATSLAEDEESSQPLPEGLSKKASSGINKLKALKQGKAGGSGSAGLEETGTPVAEGLSKKAASGINKLKALKLGQVGAAAAPASDSGPAPARNAASGINKLKALKQGKSGPKPGGPVSAGPEAPGEALPEGLAKKAASGINKLKALKQGKAGGGPKKPGGPISAGPEAPGQALSEGLSKKAASGIDKLKALKIDRAEDS